MNITSRLIGRAEATALSGQVVGHWFNIRLCPDLATGELLNVGVGFIGPDGQLVTKLLDRFEGFQYLYRGRLAADDISFMMRTIRASLPRQLAPQQLPVTASPHVAYSDLKFASGDDAQSIVDGLYHETVTLARAGKLADGSKRVEPAVGTAAARKLVFAELRRLDHWADRFIFEEAEWLIQEEGGRRALDMPIRAADFFGNIISAGYRDKQTLELNLLKAEVDMSTAKRLFPRNRGGLFILRPEDRTLPERQQQDIDNVLDMVEWRSRLEKVHFILEREPKELAEQILAWAD